jgi:peroxiredoxin
MRFFVAVICVCVLLVAGCSGGAPTSGRADDRLYVGDMAPGFALTDLSTNEITDFGKDAYTNRATVLTFWSMACPSCKAALLEVKKADQAYSDLGVVFLGVNFDTENLQGVRAFVKGEAIPFPTLWDKGRRVVRDYKALDYTFSIFVVDKGGEVLLAQYDHPPDLYDVLAETLDEVVERAGEKSQ